jgi:hypothetical protein
MGGVLSPAAKGGALSAAAAGGEPSAAGSAASMVCAGPFEHASAAVMHNAAKGAPVIASGLTGPSLPAAAENILVHREVRAPQRNLANIAAASISRRNIALSRP